MWQPHQVRSHRGSREPRDLISATATLQTKSSLPQRGGKPHRSATFIFKQSEDVWGKHEVWFRLMLSRHLIASLKYDTFLLKLQRVWLSVKRTPSAEYILTTKHWIMGCLCKNSCITGVILKRGSSQHLVYESHMKWSLFDLLNLGCVVCANLNLKSLKTWQRAVFNHLLPFY